MSNLFTELKRRNVFRAGAAYVIVAWVIAQAFDLAADNFGAPDWVMKVILIALIAGLPIALLLAWAFELTPDGVKKSDEVAATESITPRTGQTLNRITTTALILLIAFVAWDKLGPAQDTQLNSVLEKSVAVLPFADLSELQDQEWFADGLTEEILNSLAKLPELKVTARTSSFEFKNHNVDVSEIARKLGVAHVVEGSVRRIGNQLRVTAQLIRAHDGFHLWSNTYDSTTDDLFDVQHDVAENIASTLDVILDDEKRERMFSSGTRNVAAFEAFQKGRELFQMAHSRQTANTVSLADANALFERAMELDPTFSMPAIMHSDRYAHRLLEGPARIVGGADDLSAADAYEMMMKDFDFAVNKASDPFLRILAELNREFFSTDWDRLPSLLEELKATVHENISLSSSIVWLPEILLVFGELELLEKFASHRIVVDPLNISSYLDEADILAARGDLETATQQLDLIRRRFGTSNRLREAEIRFAIRGGNFDLAVQLMEDGFDMSTDYAYFQPILAAMKGNHEESQALARTLMSANPMFSMYIVYSLVGDRDAARAEVARIDALPAGPTAITMDLVQLSGIIWFDIDDAPRLKKNFEQAGIDSTRFEFEPISAD